MSNEVRKFYGQDARGVLCVRASDYAALEAECERLRGLFEESEQHLHHWQRQAAANGRSTKAMEQKRDALATELAAIRAAGGEEVEVVAIAEGEGELPERCWRGLKWADRIDPMCVPACSDLMTLAQHQRIVAAMAAELGKARKGFPAMVEYVEEIAQLRAELEAARKQEPVATLHAERLLGHAGEYRLTVDRHSWLKECRRVGGEFPLYALPPLAGKVAAPETWRDQLLREYPNSDPDYWTEELIINAQSREIAEWRALLATPSMEVKHGD